jgi:hypothetical protein
MEFVIAILALVLLDVLAMRFGADSRRTEADSRSLPAPIYQEI